MNWLEEVLLTVLVGLSPIWAALGIGAICWAARMGISPPTARRYVREPGSMTMDSMRKMNRVLDVSAEDARANLAVK